MDTAPQPDPISQLALSAPTLRPPLNNQLAAQTYKKKQLLISLFSFDDGSSIIGIA